MGTSSASLALLRRPMRVRDGLALRPLVRPPGLGRGLLELHHQATHTDVRIPGLTMLLGPFFWDNPLLPPDGPWRLESGLPTLDHLRTAPWQQGCCTLCGCTVRGAMSLSNVHWAACNETVQTGQGRKCRQRHKGIQHGCRSIFGEAPTLSHF